MCRVLGLIAAPQGRQSLPVPCLQDLQSPWGADAGGYEPLFPPSVAEPGGGVGRTPAPLEKNRAAGTARANACYTNKPKKPSEAGFLGRRKGARTRRNDRKDKQGLLGRDTPCKPFGAGRWTRHRAPQSARRTPKRGGSPHSGRAPNHRHRTREGRAQRTPLSRI